MSSTNPSDAELLNTTASLLAAMPGPRLSQPLSDLLRYVCSISAPGEHGRAERLATKLTDHLVDGMVLHRSEASPAGLDRWAAMVTVASVRVRLAGCARRHSAER